MLDQLATDEESPSNQRDPFEDEADMHYWYPDKADHTEAPQGFGLQSPEVTPDPPESDELDTLRLRLDNFRVQPSSHQSNVAYPSIDHLQPQDHLADEHVLPIYPALPRANTGTRASEVSPEFNESNILPSRTRGGAGRSGGTSGSDGTIRRETYYTDLANPRDLLAFTAAFAARASYKLY